MPRIKILILCLLCSLGSRADIAFRHIDVTQGLSQNTVYSILQDRMGFMWFGTKSGLNRYDGSSFKIYLQEDTPYSLGSDYITALYEDSQGQIWVGTDKGVWIYNPLTDTFSHFTLRSSNGQMVTGYVNVIKAHAGNIYIAANEQGLFVYNCKKKSLTNWRLPDHPNISGLGFDHEGHLWIGFFGGGLWHTSGSPLFLTPFTPPQWPTTLSQQHRLCHSGGRAQHALCGLR